MKFAVYDKTTGKMVRTGVCYPEDLHLQANDNEEVKEVADSPPLDEPTKD